MPSPPPPRRSWECARAGRLSLPAAAPTTLPVVYAYPMRTWAVCADRTAPVSPRKYVKTCFCNGPTDCRAIFSKSFRRRQLCWQWHSKYAEIYLIRFATCAVPIYTYIHCERGVRTTYACIYTLCDVMCTSVCVRVRVWPRNPIGPFKWLFTRNASSKGLKVPRELDRFQLDLFLYPRIDDNGIRFVKRYVPRVHASHSASSHII